MVVAVVLVEGGGGGGSSANPQYGTCSTAASTYTKDVVCDGFELETGARIVVKFANANTQASPLLDVNGTGAKNIYVNGAAVSSSENQLKWTAGALLSFVYDGTVWHLEDHATCIYANSSTTASTATKETGNPGALHIVNGTIVNVLFTTANTSESKMKLNVGGTGANDIYYKGATTGASNKFLWDANTVLTFVRTGAYWVYVSRDKEQS